VLITLPDERAQIAADKAVLGDDLRPQRARRLAGAAVDPRLEAER
jgi:hypothetical protein